MNRIYIIITGVLLSASLLAQSPGKVSYQAVVRDANDILMSNTSLGIQISILQTSITGTAVYVERQFPTTNSNGLVSIEIGGINATIVSGDFSAIDWGSGLYFIKTETDLNGGSNYTISGTSQLLSVPYALHAKTAEHVENINITGNETAFDAWDKDASDDFDGQYSSLTGAPSTVSSFTNDAGYITNPDDNDANSTNEIQSLSKSGTNITLSEGGGTVSIADNDNSTTNEIQNLDIDGTSISISGGNSVNLNEISGYSTISIPAFAMTRNPSSTIITQTGGGLQWEQNFASGTSIVIKKPNNYNGGDVKFSIFFRTTSGTSGMVDFFIRPNSYNNAEGFIDPSSVNTNAVNVSGSLGFGTLYEQIFTIPADKLIKDWWIISIQRQGSNSTYEDNVIVMSSALTY